MPEPENKQSFWTTIPGILTGLAAVLTAGTGLFLALNHPRNAASEIDHSPPSAVSSVAPSSSPMPAANPVSSTAAAASKDGVTLTSRGGEVTHLLTKSFRHGVAGQAIELTSGQTIPFEKIRSIDFETVSNSEVTVGVALTDGRVISGSLSTNAIFEGENDIGPFSIYVANVKRIVLQP